VLGRSDDRIFLRAATHQTTSEPGTACHLAVKDQNFAPVLIRDQLTLLHAERRGTPGCGVRDRTTRVHLEDAVLRIDQALEP
jgi:hypothetical protein